MKTASETTDPGIGEPVRRTGERRSRPEGGSRLAAAVVVTAGVVVGVLMVRALGPSGPGGARIATLGAHRHAPLITPAPRSGGSGRGRRTAAAAAAGVVPAGEVTVAVSAGGGSAGAVRRVLSELRSYGYRVAAAASSPTGVSGAGVYFRVGYTADAALLGERLDLPPSAVQALPAAASTSATSGPDVVVVLQASSGAANG